MATYCYTTADGETVDRFFPMGKAPRKIRLDDGRKARRNYAAERGGRGHKSQCWPQLSDAHGVHPDQIPEAMEYFRQHGHRQEFMPDGRAILESDGHALSHERIRGFFRRNDIKGGPTTPQRA